MESYYITVHVTLSILLCTRTSGTGTVHIDLSSIETKQRNMKEKRTEQNKKNHTK